MPLPYDSVPAHRLRPFEVASGGGTVANSTPSILVLPGADGCIVYAATSKAPWISDLSPSANQAVPGICAPGSMPCLTGEKVTPTFNVVPNTRRGPFNGRRIEQGLRHHRQPRRW